MECLLWFSLVFGLFSCYFCRQGIRLSDKRMVAATQMRDAEQVGSLFLTPEEWFSPLTKIGYHHMASCALSGVKPIGNLSTGSNPNFQALIEAASDGFLSRDEIRRFAPDTPAPNDVECYVEVEMYRTERIGGRCVNFGRTNLRVCQAGEYSGSLFNNQCRRQPGADAQSQATNPPAP